MYDSLEDRETLWTQEADSCRFIFRNSSYFVLYFRNVRIGCWKSQNDEKLFRCKGTASVLNTINLRKIRVIFETPDTGSFPIHFQKYETTRWNEVSSFRIVISSKRADNVFEKRWLVRGNHLASEPSNGKQSTDRKPSHLAWKSF